MKKIKILTTLGPSSLNENTIRKLDSREVDYFRINMSHTSIEELEKHIYKIREFSDISICIDSEGAQVRTSIVPENLSFDDRQEIDLVPSKLVEDDGLLGLWPSNVFEQLKVGTILTIDFNSVLLVVNSTRNGSAKATILNGGLVGSNKAVTLFPTVKLPALSVKDVKAVKLGLKLGIKDFALSFANSANDILELRKFTGKKSKIISKIESKRGVRNLKDILKITDSVLIDRGDLSREVPLENIPLIQKKVIKETNSMGKEAYVATNLLESMMENSKPTRAEVNDVVNTLIDGTSGLVLAAETAIGKQPVKSVDMLRSLISKFQLFYPDGDINKLIEYENILLPKMHGVDNRSKHYKPNKIVSNTRKYIDIDENNFLDVSQLIQGVYSPLSGFMNSTDLENVLNNYKLENGEVWPLPIILQVNKDTWSGLEVGMVVPLKYSGSPSSKMAIQVTELYKIDLKTVSKKWFGTTDLNHPGVERLMSLGNYVVSGSVSYNNYKEMLSSPYFLTPKQTRMIFDMKGWSRVVAFHTRNVPHRAHEYLMKDAMRQSNADGLLIQPVVGPKKKGDFSSDAILSTYDILIKNHLPKALLTTFSTYSRYSGPREAVFTALCRKNYGCTHFIVGRDHTGVGEYYKDQKNSDLFEKIEDIGIKIIYFNQVGYSKSKNKIIESNNDSFSTDIVSISGTKIRNAIKGNLEISHNYFRKEILDHLRLKIKNNESVFID